MHGWATTYIYHRKLLMWLPIHGLILVNSSPPSLTYITLANRVSIGSGNGLSPVWGQAITRTNVPLLSTEPSGTNFNVILTEIQNFWITKMPSAKWQPFYPGEVEFIPANKRGPICLHLDASMILCLWEQILHKLSHQSNFMFLLYTHFSSWEIVGADLETKPLHSLEAPTFNTMKP